jgi:hypothetical protein
MFPLLVTAQSGIVRGRQMQFLNISSNIFPWYVPALEWNALENMTSLVVSVRH